jgi:hypothetical protein
MKSQMHKAIIFLFMLWNINLYSQKHFINFTQVKVDSISSIEENFNSKVYTSDLDLVTTMNDSIVNYGKLKKYRRPKNNIYGKIVVTYFYLKNDSIVRDIHYSWIPPQNSRLKEFSKQFDLIVKDIATELGLAVEEQGKLTKKKEEVVVGETVKIKERRVIWEYKGFEILILMAYYTKNEGQLNIWIKKSR